MTGKITENVFQEVPICCLDFIPKTSIRPHPDRGYEYRLVMQHRRSYTGQSDGALKIRDYDITAYLTR